MQSLTLKKPSPFTRNHLLRDAIGQAMYEAMEQDSSLHLFGEGAHMKAHYDTPKIEADFSDRVHTLPISEDGNTNFAVGASLLGVKPIVDVISADFLYRTMDSICNTAAKLNFVSDPPKTIVIRAEFLLGGPSTGQRPEALFAHIPGLNVIIPSTPRDAYELMWTALETPGVTLFFEDRMIEDTEWSSTGQDWKRSHVPLGASAWCHKGKRATTTIVTYGLMRQVVERALKPFSFNGDYYAEDYNMLCDVIDLRSLYPIHWSFIIKLLERTGRLLIVEPDVQYGGIGAEIAATIVEKMPQCRIKRLGAPRVTIPASMSLHAQMLPTEEDIIRVIKADW